VLDVQIVGPQYFSSLGLFVGGIAFWLLVEADLDAEQSPSLHLGNKLGHAEQDDPGLYIELPI
jgi:hypothetical protein